MCELFFKQFYGVKLLQIIQADSHNCKKRMCGKITNEIILR